MIGPQLGANFQTVVAGPRQNDRLRTQRLGNGDAKQAYWPRPGHHDTFARHQSTKFGQAVHRRTRRYHQSCLGVAHRVAHVNQGVDVVDGVLAKPAIGRKSIRAVAFVHVAIVLAVIVARGVHAGAATLALAATRMDFDGNPIANAVLIDSRSKSNNRAHVFMARGKILIERQATFDRRGRALVDNFEIRSANRDCVNPH